MPISSLPSPYGIGTLGKTAYDWIDFLKESGQSWWQILPLGPTSYGAVELGATMAIILMGIIPVIIFYLCCQKYIIKGVAAGAVKG